jgi:hypothetical protein
LRINPNKERNIMMIQVIENKVVIGLDINENGLVDCQWASMLEAGIHRFIKDCGYFEPSSTPEMFIAAFDVERENMCASMCDNLSQGDAERARNERRWATKVKNYKETGIL